MSKYTRLTVVGVFAMAVAIGAALVTAAPAKAQVNVITVDVTPFGLGGLQKTMGQALQAVDQGGDFFVTEVTPAAFEAMTVAQLSAFDLIAIDIQPGRIAGGIGTTWQSVAGCDNGGRTMLNSHDAPRFHMNFTFPFPLFTGFEPFGAPDLVR